MKKENQKIDNIFDENFNLWDGDDWNSSTENTPAAPDTTQEKVTILPLPPEVLNRKPGHVFDMEDEIKVLKYLGWYDELPENEK